MKTWKKTAGILFVAAMSVYSDQVIAARPAKPVSSSDKSQATEVKVLDQATDPFATGDAASASASSEAQSKAVASPLQVNTDGTFSLNITAGADLVEQLRVIGFQAQMSIIPSREVHGTLPAMDLYNVTVHEALDALLSANGYAWREKGKFIYVYSAKEIAEMEKASRVAQTRVFRVYYTPAANAVNMIKPVLSSDAQVSVSTPATVGIQTGTSDVGGNSHADDDVIVVTDYPENLERVAQVLKEVDRRPQQILVEATILRASLSEDNALGIDFNLVGGVDFASLDNTISTSNGQMGAAGTGSITLGSNTVHTVGTGNNFTSGVTGGLKVGVLTNNVAVFLAALEEVTDTTILANPKVLALNKQKGEVIVGRETGYLTTTFTETSSSQTVEFLKTGTRLVFRPYIAGDGYIRMEVHPEDSTGGLQTAANLPYKITTEVTSNVMVKDGHTIVIGGLFRESSDVTRSQVPGLGNLPVAGALFRNQADSTTREEVIILLTPHIVKDDSVYSELSEQALKDAEKLRVGVRKGMMFWGRQRLADMSYEWAVSEAAKSNRTLALWYLDAATNLNPKLLEAIDLKQQLTGKQISTTDGSSIRSFVRRAMLRDVAPATQPAADAGSEADAAPKTPPSTLPVAEAPAAQTSQPVEQASEHPSAEQTASTDVKSDAQEQQPAVVAETEQTAKPTQVADSAEPPATQPTAKGFGWSDLYSTAGEAISSDEDQQNAGQTTVTELPTDELPAADQDNK